MRHRNVHRCNRGLVQRQDEPRALRRGGFATLSIALLIILAAAVPAFSEGPEAEAEQAYWEILREIQPERIERTMRAFGQTGRLGGPPRQLIERLKGPGGLGVLGHVVEERFTVTVPDPNAVGIVSTPQGSIEVFPLWPNGVRTSTCDVSGPLIYAGDGAIERFDGQDVKGSIVLMEFNSGQNWRNAARLGAAAVIFLEPVQTQRTQGEAKWSKLPHNCPRFWASRAEAGPLLASLGQTVRLTCRQKWVDQEVSNLYVAVPGSDPLMRDEWVLLSAYTDSVSVVPALSPGADQFCGAAALLELARVFKDRRPRRSALFLLTTAHFQALQGVRAFIEKRFQDGWEITGGKTPQFSICFDLSSRNAGVVASAQGWWVDYRPENIETERAVARALGDRMDSIGRALRISRDRLFADGVNNPDGRHWKNHVPGRFALEAEMFNLAGMNAVTFMTSQDTRNIQDTPFDRLETVNLGNVVTQTRVLGCLLHHILNDAQDVAGAFSMPYRGGSAMKRMSLIAGFGTISGRVLSYDPRRSFLPDVPMKGALVVLRQGFQSYLGVRGALIVRAGYNDGRYSLYGVPPVTSMLESLRGPIAVWAFVLDENDRISHTLDFRRQDDGTFSTVFMMKTSFRETPAVVFACEVIDFYGVVDPHLLRSYNYVQVLDARNNGPPRRYAFDIPAWDRSFHSFVEDSIVVYAVPGTRIKVLAGLVPGEARLALTNSTLDDVAGGGYLVGGDAGVANSEDGRLSDRARIASAGLFPHPALESARDLWAINEGRIRKLKTHRIINVGINDLQQSARDEIAAADQALNEKVYSAADRHARAAWGYALRAHPQLLATTKDILNGLIFYLALLLPFSYFIERLLFASKKMTGQLLVAGTVFIVVFLALRVLHPAFELTGNTLMIFVAFIMGALSLIVITFVVGKFESGIQKLQQQVGGVHQEQVGKIGIALTALNIGISNMRRRRARTVLTCATLVIVTFIVLSFTSVVTELRFNEVPTEGTPRYSGILLRDPSLMPLEENAYRSLRTEFSRQGTVGRRAWFYGAEIGAQSVLSVTGPSGVFDVTAILGMDPQESKISRPQDALLPGGRWFREGDVFAVILPASVAERLKIRHDDVGKAAITFGGSEFRVIGIADDAKLKAITDLDRENIMPADFGVSRQLQMQGRGGDLAFRKYIRVDPSTIMLIPAETAVNMGADIRSIAVSFPSIEDTQSAMKTIMPRLGLNLYAAAAGPDGPEIRRFSTIAAPKTRGLEYVAIPVILAAIIVLNTMIASVLERRREIGILSAVGLSPRHIAALFFAESLVYAVIGAVFGYLLAQTAAKVVVATDAFPGIYLNFSSLSAIMATLVVVSVVLLSTIYPAYVAARVATPAGTEEWRAAPPEGDRWLIPLPFTVSRSHAEGLSRFYEEWFAGHEEYSIGEFVTENVRAGKTDTERGEGFYAAARCWLTPYDLGVQQDFSLIFSPTDIPDVCDITAEIVRVAGDPEHWENLNRRFLRSLRKQFLIWRTLRPEEKASYFEPVST